MKKVFLTGLFASLLASSVPATVSAAYFNSNTLTNIFKTMETRDEDGMLIETEPNDSIAQANSLLHFEPITADFDSAHDTDYYTFSLDKRFSHLALSGYKNEEGDINLAFDLLNHDGKSIQPNETDGDKQETAKFYELHAGTYYVKVAESSGQASQSEYDQYSILAFPIDTTPPGVPVVHSVDDNDTQITGKAEPHSLVSVMSGSKRVVSVYASRTGGFTAPLEAPIKASTSLSVIASDDWGHESKAKKIVVKDKTAPTLPKVNAVHSGDKKVTGSAERNSAITIKVGAKVIATGRANSKGKFTVSVKAQKKGTVLYVAAADKAKNVSTSARVVVKKG